MNEANKRLTANISSSSTSREDDKPKSISDNSEEDKLSEEEDPYKRIFLMFQDQLELKQLELYKDTVRDSKKLFKFLEVVKENFEI